MRKLKDFSLEAIEESGMLALSADLFGSASFWTSIVIIFALAYKWWKKPHPDFPPLIRGVPFLGVIPYLDKFPQKTLKKWSLEMKEPVIAVRMGSEDTVIINTYEAAFKVQYYATNFIFF